MSIARLRASYPVRIRWVHFPLHPETPGEGLALEELFPGRDLRPMKQRMSQLMADAGLPYGSRTHTYNSRLAQELGKWAETLENGEAIHDALYQAYFVDGKNIADIDTLAAIAEGAGLDGKTARQVLAERLFEGAVDEDWRYSRELAVTGVPTFHSKGLVVVGCQPYETLEQFVRHLLQSD